MVTAKTFPAIRLRLENQNPPSVRSLVESNSISATAYRATDRLNLNASVLIDLNFKLQTLNFCDVAAFGNATNFAVYLSVRIGSSLEVGCWTLEFFIRQPSPVLDESGQCVKPLSQPDSILTAENTI